MGLTPIWACGCTSCVASSVFESGHLCASTLAECVSNLWHGWRQQQTDAAVQVYGWLVQHTHRQCPPQWHQQTHTAPAAPAQTAAAAGAGGCAGAMTAAHHAGGGLDKGHLRHHATATRRHCLMLRCHPACVSCTHVLHACPACACRCWGWASPTSVRPRWCGAAAPASPCTMPSSGWTTGPGGEGGGVLGLRCCWRMARAAYPFMPGCPGQPGVMPLPSSHSRVVVQPELLHARHR